MLQLIHVDGSRFWISEATSVGFEVEVDSLCCSSHGGASDMVHSFGEYTIEAMNDN